ncbi:MAG: glycoside hydrolase family 65 [Bryobacteraceae bacterium]
MRRRDFLGGLAAPAITAPGTIERRALVRRHNPVLPALDPRSPLSVGNGEFAFSADITGLQTFPALYQRAMPLCTQSQWGWHSAPGTETFEDLRLEPFDTYGRAVGYPTSAAGQKERFAYLRENPHRLHLGRIGLRLAGVPSGIKQELDLWSGVLRSRFEGGSTEVCCHPQLDMVAARVDCPASDGVLFEFPYGSSAMHAADWNSPGKHRTTIVSQDAGGALLRRELDGSRYYAAIRGGRVTREGPHTFVLRATSFVCLFAKEAPHAPLPTVEESFAASSRHWERFWSTGGAIDLSESTDPHARELERRIVLSQYLTAIQCAGSLPPQETGLTCNSWYGKFHLEMHWWHAAHFVLWDRAPLVERSLGYYSAILPRARETARRQGCTGARWPKMTDPRGIESPSGVGPLLIWQQPHPIAFAELVYAVKPTRETLERYRDVVFETAEFMASFAVYDEKRARYVLGPPVIPAQENHPPRETWNPTFELEYWDYGLAAAARWRQRLGMQPEPRWERVRRHLSGLPVKDGLYLAHENCPQTFTERNRDHPSMLGALGVLPGAKVDRETMRRTLRKVFECWRWPDTWGWDYPMIAMTAARLGEPELAIRALLMDTPKNVWLPNGHNYQRPNLPLYLPGNGGLLTATAMMAAAWRGFPAGWTARWEGLRPVLK